MKSYIDQMNRMSILGTDCMPMATAMVDGRLDRVFAAIEMLDCVHGLRHSDDETVDVLRASFPIDRCDLKSAESNGSLGHLFNRIDMLECLHGDRHDVEEVTEVMHAFFDLFGDEPNPKFAKVEMSLAC